MSIPLAELLDCIGQDIAAPGSRTLEAAAHLWNQPPLIHVGTWSGEKPITAAQAPAVLIALQSSAPADVLLKTEPDGTAAVRLCSAVIDVAVLGRSPHTHADIDPALETEWRDRPVLVLAGGLRHVEPWASVVFGDICAAVRRYGWQADEASADVSFADAFPAPSLTLSLPVYIPTATASGRRLES